MSGDFGNLFKKITSLRKTNTVVATSIDGVQENVSEHFKDIYSPLYNSVDDVENMTEEMK